MSTKPPCTKRRHATAEAAQRHLVQVETYNASRGQSKPGRLMVYRCDRCPDTYHVGHTKKKGPHHESQ